MDPKDVRKKLNTLNNKRRLLIDTIAKRDCKPTEEERVELENMADEARDLEQLLEQHRQVAAAEQALADSAIANTEPRNRDEGGEVNFRSIGEVAAAYWSRNETNGRPNHPMHERAQSMGDPTSGGIMIPETISNVIRSVSPEAAIMRPRATVIPAGEYPDAAVTVIAFDQGSNGVYGGLTMPKRAEAGAITEPENVSLRWVTLDPTERARYIEVTGKMMRNWPAMAAFIDQWFRKTAIGLEDYLFLRGTGVNEPLGIMNSAARVLVARNTSSEFKFADAATMFASMFMDASPLFVMNQTLLPQVVQMADANGNSIYIAGDATKGISGSLLGVPVRFTGRTPVLGSLGDAMLIDPSYFLIKDGFGPVIKTDSSVKLLTSGGTVIVIQWSMDGRAWMNEPLTLEDGSTTVSPFVVLNA